MLSLEIQSLKLQIGKAIKRTQQVYFMTTPFFNLVCNHPLK